LWVANAAVAQGPTGRSTPNPTERAEPGAPAPKVSLDQLLKLPEDRDYRVDLRGGYTQSEWRELFTKAHAALEAQKKNLARAEAQMRGVAHAKSSWKVGLSLPGIQESSGDAPLDYQLGRRIDAAKEEIARLKKVLQDLKVEADLAGVPAGWRS